MLRETTKQKEADALKRALAEKPATPGFNEDYVPSPVVNIQAQIEGRGRRPSPAEVNAERERAASQLTVDELKERIPAETHRGPVGPAAEAVEASHAESVDFIRRRLQQNAAEETEGRVQREARAHQESLDLIRAEMETTIRTQDYSG